MMHPFMRDINGNPFPDTPTGRIVGRWPGNETDEEIEQALNMTNTRRNITQPADWWAAFDAAAQAGGTDLSAWLGEAGRRMLPRAERNKLSERVTRGRPAKSKEANPVSKPLAQAEMDK